MRIAFINKSSLSLPQQIKCRASLLGKLLLFFDLRNLVPVAACNSFGHHERTFKEFIQCYRQPAGWRNSLHKFRKIAKNYIRISNNLVIQLSSRESENVHLHTAANKVLLSAACFLLSFSARKTIYQISNHTLTIEYGPIF